MIPDPMHCPAWDVPPPRAVRGSPCRAQACTVETTSSSVRGKTTAAGTISLYLGGVLVQVAVAAGDAATAIATAMSAAITASARFTT